MTSDGYVYVSLGQLMAMEFPARGLSFAARQPQGSILAGNHASRLRGRGLNFDELRRYQPGDDLRHLDWRASLRTGKPVVRTFTEERDRAADRRNRRAHDNSARAWAIGQRQRFAQFTFECRIVVGRDAIECALRNLVCRLWFRVELAWFYVDARVLVQIEFGINPAHHGRTRGGFLLFQTTVVLEETRLLIRLSQLA